MQSGSTSWVTVGSAMYRQPGLSYEVMNDGSVHLLGLPDGQTPFAALRVGYSVNFSGSVLTITALNGGGLSGQVVAPTTGGYQISPYIEDTVTFSDSSVWTIMAILQQAGNPNSGVIVIGTTTADLTETQ